MENLLQDVRFGFRTLSSNPLFTAVAVITLALGIGANTAMFSIVNGILLRPLEFPEPGQLVAIKRINLGDDSTGGNTTPGNFTAWMERSTSFSAMATLGGDLASLASDDGARRVAGVRAAGSLHEVFGTPALFGRTLTRQDDDAGDKVVVLSFDFWQRQYGDNRDILGDALVLDEVPHTIVGVMPREFEFRYFAEIDVDFWGPSGWSAEYRRNRNNYAHEVIARLAPGVSLQRAQQEMDAIMAELRAEHPAANRDHGVQIVSLHDELVSGIDSLLLLLMGAAGLVLLIATVNLANLLLARAGSRQEEIAVRRAIGATPARLARQMLTESVVLAMLGGAVGLGLAVLLTRVLATLIPAELPTAANVSIDPIVLAFTFAIAAAAGLVFGLFPTLRLLRPGSTGAFAGRGSRPTSWTWSALVIAEVALSVILLVGAGLLLRSFVNLLGVDPGFRAERIMTFTIALPEHYEPERRVALWHDLRQEFEAIPGVTAAAVANQLPSETNRVSGWFNYIDHPVDNSDRSFLVPYRLVSPGYFEALGIPVVRGRGFNDTDGGNVLGAIINEAAVKRFWPDREPIGDRIGLGSRDGDLWYPPATVVGIAGDVRNAGITADTLPAVYFPIEMASGWTNLTFALRTVGEPSGVLRAARDRLARLDPAAPMFSETTAEEMLARQVAPTRAMLQLMGTLAGLGLAMAAIGVFGVLSYSVSRRTREIGIRTALGANATTLTSMVVGQAMAKVLAGTALGLIVSVGATRLLAGMLFEVSSSDPWTLAGVALVLCLIALLASYVPARRAVNVDPTVALRHN